METPFDLTRAIQHWRESLAQSPAFRGENLVEMESHLRDSMAGLQTRGLSEEESFLIAARRLGSADALEQEFGKVNASAVWGNRALWMLGGMLFLTIGWDLINTVSSGLTCLGSMFSPNGWTLGWAEGVAGIGMFALMVWLFWRLASGHFSGLGSITGQLNRRPALFIGGAITGLVLLHLVPSVFQMLCIRNLGPTALGQKYFLTRTLTLSLMPLVQLVLMVVVFTRLQLRRASGSAGRRLAMWALILPAVMALTLGSAHAQISAGPAQPAASDKQAPATLDQTMTLWRAGKKDEAMAKFLAVDFSKRPLFPTGSVLNYSEAQFIGLPQAARDKMARQMQDDLKTIKEICAHVKATAKNALDSGDKPKSEQCLAQLKACGEAFDQPGSLALLKLVGKGIQRMAAQ